MEWTMGPGNSTYETCEYFYSWYDQMFGNGTDNSTYDYPDNETDPYWQCYSYSCEYFHQDLSWCVLDNCTHNQTWESWCKVNFTTWSGDSEENMDCEDFFSYNDTDYNNTDNSTNNDTYDPRNDPNWNCYSYECSYFGPIEGCNMTSCSENSEPWGYWCQIDYEFKTYTCDEFWPMYEDYWYWSAFYMNSTEPSPYTPSMDYYKPDNWTNPDWYCDDYNCTWFSDDLDNCFVQNCTNNQTWEQWCKVNYTTYYQNETQDDCDTVFKTEGFFSFDPREDPDWYCQS